MDPARQKSEHHMRSILVAFHNYNSANAHFPPAAIYGSDGGPKLSWRVAILPYLGEGALFEEFHMNEPWDSPHNKALIGRMPEVSRRRARQHRPARLASGYLKEPTRFSAIC